jgi:hypothetical protein
MEKFLVLIREDLSILKQTSQEDHNKSIGQMMKWVESLAESGNFTSGESLLNTGKYISRDDVLSNGPFLDSQEGISGYLFLQAENLNQAASIAQSCPLIVENRMVMEIRPIRTINNALIHG